LKQASAPLFIRARTGALVSGLSLVLCASLAGCAPASSPSAYEERAALLAATESEVAATPLAPSYFTPETIAGIPAADVVDTFSLRVGMPAPVLNPLARMKMLDTVNEIEKQGDCSFVFLDVQSGLGISHNADTEVYTASCAKAVLGYYALMKAEEAGEELPAQTKALIARSIESSSNEAFETLCVPYITVEYEEWLARHGVRLEYAQYGPYLNASGKGLTSLWAEMYTYLEGGSENARWLAGLLGNTNRSYIRDGVQNTGATTMNKGGWIDGDEVDSTSDAGLVTIDGRTYLMVVLSGQPSTGISQQRMAHLAKLLFDQRDALNETAGRA
jgi:hypothetical protein